MKPKTLLLSELWGFNNAEWLKGYTEALEDKHDLILLDSRELAGIDATIDDEKLIHNQFVDHGIEQAVERLIADYSSQSVSIIGFSVGGLIGWKAAMKGLNVKRLICISSTRLRYEPAKPDVELELYFGDADPYQPKDEWFDEMQLKPYILKGGHSIYKEPDLVKTFISNL